ncbi:hypothetical protein [Candidatus Coxiella mudrowiae]|uniref:hypothetical protein n=1 Tax=Candidatus Coxiella mudrowiae TaxID=2054173 RepID=UPI001F30DAB1|nr:hypothetical protein [Candidatus Coxiella mudrowiae]
MLQGAAISAKKAPKLGIVDVVAVCCPRELKRTAHYFDLQKPTPELIEPPLSCPLCYRG